MHFVGLYYMISAYTCPYICLVMSSLDDTPFRLCYRASLCVELSSTSLVMSGLDTVDVAVVSEVV